MVTLQSTVPVSNQFSESNTDYARIAAAIAFVRNHVDRQPGLEAIADHLQISPWHCQRLFSRWAGISPKRFLQILTVQRAKPLLASEAPLLEVADNVGLSSASRLYDHFVNLEAMTPGEYKAGGAGLQMEYGVHDTPFGQAFIAATSRGICRLAFVDDEGRVEHEHLIRRWPNADIKPAPRNTQKLIDTVFNLERRVDRPLSLLVAGTNFQVSIWRALLRIPPATLLTYSQLAQSVGRPRAARAVGRAVGANPLAYIIPCHRVIRESGGQGGYHWGLTRKQAIQAWEIAHLVKD